MYSVQRPKYRSKLRKLAGKEYFCIRENLRWMFGSEKLARDRSLDELEVKIVEHQSLLLRPLKNVDMQLQINKITNLRLALEKLDGIVIKPGETFSIWQLVGRPTRSRGFLDGMTLSNGQVTKGTGGGLCQLGNLIYWMTLHSPLTVTKRWRHSYDVFPDVNRKIPFGSGATLSYNYIDLQIKNTTDQNFQLKLWLSSTHLHGLFCSDKEWEMEVQVIEKNHRIEQQYWGGYTRHNEIWRTLKDRNTGALKEEFITENHAIMMYNPLLEYGDT